MKQLALLTLLVASGAVTYAYADDPTPNDEQMIKTCMEKQKTNSNVTMSDAQLRRYCKDQLKQQKDTGQMPEKPPMDAPKD